MLMQQLVQRLSLKSVNVKADDVVLVVIEDRGQHQGLSGLLTLLRLPFLDLVTCPVQLFQAETAAEEVGRDDNEHDSGSTQGDFHLSWRMIAEPAGRVIYMGFIKARYNAAT